MHKFVKCFFNNLVEFLLFVKIVCLLAIMCFSLYWANHLANFGWNWLSFISPLFDFLIENAEKICSASWNFFGAIFEMKFFLVLIFFVLLAYVSALLVDGVREIERVYENTRKIYNKNKENVFNQKLMANITHEEKKISLYSVYIKTQLKKKFSHQELNINIEEQNKKMCEIIEPAFAQEAEIFNNGFLYNFGNFNNIDYVLDVLVKLMKSSLPLDYAISIQINNNKEQLTKLSELDLFGKIVMAADTSYRYRFNKSHRYQMSLVGLFQNGENTLEVHEFKEIL